MASPPGNGGRGLKLTQAVGLGGFVVGIAPRQRGAWIETRRPWWLSCPAMASPPGNGGRGLKLEATGIDVFQQAHRPPATGGVD